MSQRRLAQSSPSQDHSAPDTAFDEDYGREVPGELPHAFGQLGSEQSRLGNAALAERAGLTKSSASDWDISRWLFGEDAEEPGLQIEDAAQEQLAPVAEAVAGARRMADTGLAVLAAGPTSPRHAGLLSAHYHTQDPGLLGEAAGVLRAARAGLGGAVEVEVESFSPFLGELFGGRKALAYVYRGLVTGHGHGAIHLTPQFFTLSPADQAATMLHEATHMWAATDDHAYAGTSEYRALSPEDALDNADSHSTFCALHQLDQDAEQAALSEAQAQAAARQHAEALWGAYQAGDITLWRDGFTTPEGLSLDPEQVATTINAYFREHFPEHCQDAVARLGADPAAELSWPDGVRLGPDLARGIDSDPAEGWCG